MFCWTPSLSTGGEARPPRGRYPVPKTVTHGVLAGLVPAIHDFACVLQESRGWPAVAGHDGIGQGCKEHGLVREAEREHPPVAGDIQPARGGQDGHEMAQAGERVAGE